MDTGARILYLAVKQMANEATSAELTELNNLLAKNPEIADFLRQTFAVWDIIDFDSPVTVVQIDHNIELVLNRIHTIIDQINKP
jgi:hypothetical protein